MSGKIWRGAMIGAGAWSEIQLDAWKCVENVQIEALCDRHPERRDPIAQKYGIPRVYDHLEELLAELDLDFVDICVRPYSHAALTKVVADRGVPILCQKPFCTTFAEAEEVVAYCFERDVRLMINENWRWQPWHRQMKVLLDSGVLGEPFLVRMVQRVRSTLPHDMSNHPQAYFATMPRLSLLEIGVHYLDTMRFLFGEPSTLYARTQRVSPHILGEDVFVIVLGYENTTCLIESSWASVQVPGLDTPGKGVRNSPLLSRFEIDGYSGTMALSGDGRLRLVTDYDEQEWLYSRDSAVANSHAAAQRHFIECLESGDEFETSGAETLKTMRLMYASYRSAEENQVIKHLKPKA